MKIGIAGAGLIIPDFLDALAHVKGAEPLAICGTEHDIARMEALQNTYRIPSIYTNYPSMLAREDIDTVYVAVPNHLHYAFAKQAIEAGKHVILEKPFASCLAQAMELVALSRAYGVMLHEAITNQYFPNYRKVKELLPRLGDIKIVELNYSQYSRRYDAFKAGEILPVFDPKKSGGALMDLNVYNIHFVVGLFGEPLSIRYHANVERGIDTSGMLFLQYPTFLCVLIAAKDCHAPVCINVQGDRGYIHSDAPANLFPHFFYGENGTDPIAFDLHDRKERLYYELQAFQTMSREEMEQRLQHSLVVMRILDEARMQVGIAI